MKTLFIDTHYTDINIKLFDNNKIIKEESVIGEKYNSIYLMPTIKNVCDNNTYEEIVIVNGPGSFTGVRLGVTIAKTLAYTQNITIKPVTYFDLMIWSLDENKHILGISDSNGYYIGEFDNYISKQEYYYLSNKEFEKFCINNNVETDVTIDYEKVSIRFESILAVNPHSVKPIYIKSIGALDDKKN